MNDVIEYLKKLVASDTAKGIEKTILILKKDSNSYNHILLFQSRYQTINKEQQSGVITSETYYLHLNKIKLGLLQFIDEITEFTDDSIVINKLKNEADLKEKEDLKDNAFYINNIATYKKMHEISNNIMNNVSTLTLIWDYRIPLNKIISKTKSIDISRCSVDFKAETKIYLGLLEKAVDKGSYLNGLGSIVSILNPFDFRMLNPYKNASSIEAVQEARGYIYRLEEIANKYKPTGK